MVRMLRQFLGAMMIEVAASVIVIALFVGAFYLDSLGYRVFPIVVCAVIAVPILLIVLSYLRSRKNRT